MSHRRGRMIVSSLLVLLLTGISFGCRQGAKETSPIVDPNLPGKEPDKKDPGKEPDKEDLSPPGPQAVAIPKDYKGVTFSQDGRHVAFIVPEEKQFRVVVDGRAEPLYENVTIVAFSSSGKHYFYGGLRDKKWQLLRDGKEIAELGGLTGVTQGTGLHLLGEQVTMTIWTPLIIYFARAAENYMVVCYPGKEGKIFKDGDWLPLTFGSFWKDGFALSPDGKHYCFTVSPPESKQPTLYIDGVPGPQGAVNSIVYRQSGQRLTYRQMRNGEEKWTLMEDAKPLAGFPPLLNAGRDGYLLSPNGEHVAVLVKKGDKEAAVIDGQEGPEFPTIDWDIEDGFIPYRGSFVWSKDGSAHAYAVYDEVVKAFTTFGESKVNPVEVVQNGKRLGKHGRVRGSSLMFSADGKHLAYAAKDGDGWTTVVDGRAGPTYQDVGKPVFVGTDGTPSYAAKTATGWELHAAFRAGPFVLVSDLVVSPDQKSVVYAAKSSDGKWRAFRDAKALCEPCDGIVGSTGFQFDRAGHVRFVVKVGDELKWVTSTE